MLVEKKGPKQIKSLIMDPKLYGPQLNNIHSMTKTNKNLIYEHRPVTPANNVTGKNIQNIDTKSLECDFTKR